MTWGDEIVGVRYFAEDLDREFRAAMALFECDEDMSDESISGHIKLGVDPTPEFEPRVSWDPLAPSTRDAYLRRARAVLTADSYADVDSVKESAT